MAELRTERLSAEAEGIARAAAILRAGGLVAFPTETVYGLGALATDGTAVARIFEAKGRPRFNPLIVHVESLEAARRLAVFDDRAEALAGAFWPGPLTLVLPLRPEAGLSPLVTAGLEKVALRVPAHPVARALLAALGGPLAGPSANPSGRVSPTRADHVLDGLGGRIEAVLDGGPCEVGVESTIVETLPEPRLLRPGGLPAEAIADCIGEPVMVRTEGGPVTAPGQLLSHYAPDARLRLNARAAEEGETYLGFGPGGGDFTLSATGDLREAAAVLFQRLHEIDARGLSRVAVAPVPDTGLGRAINDRLRRAAAPRGSGAPGG